MSGIGTERLIDLDVPSCKVFFFLRRRKEGQCECQVALHTAQSGDELKKMCLQTAEGTARGQSRHWDKRVLVLQLELVSVGLENPLCSCWNPDATYTVISLGSALGGAVSPMTGAMLRRPLASSSTVMTSSYGKQSR